MENSTTKLLYLEHMDQLTCTASVQQVSSNDEKTVIYLDQTILYPQGGGQPFDIGSITDSKTIFVVNEVRYQEGRVAHYGSFQNNPASPLHSDNSTKTAVFTQGDLVTCAVDGPRRVLHSRLHSAGHVIDMAIAQLHLGWKPTKAYHFPDNPYVEYEVTVDIGDLEALTKTLQTTCNTLITENLPVTAKFVSPTELVILCGSIPTNFEDLAPEKPIRVVIFGKESAHFNTSGFFAVPCGGTHVKTLADIGSISVTKLKKKGTSLRVGYRVDQP